MALFANMKRKRIMMRAQVKPVLAALLAVVIATSDCNNKKANAFITSSKSNIRHCGMHSTASPLEANPIFLLQVQQQIMI
jgi:hypothetical protein